MKIAVSEIAQSTPLNLTIQPLYDEVQVATNQSQPLNVFVTPVGQGGKTLVNTNLRQAGGLPSPNEFYLRGFCVFPVPRAFTTAPAVTDITDLQQVLRLAIWAFYIGTNGRKLVEAPSHCFPAGFGVEGFITTGGATSGNVAHVIGNGQRRLDNKFGLADYAEKLNATESFTGQFSFPNGTLSISNAISLQVYLPGIYGQSIG